MKALFRYGRPNPSHKPEEHAFFAPPDIIEVRDEWLDLHDLRTSPEIVPGAAGLDVQGFTWVKSPSCLSGDQFLEGDNVKEFYLRECEKLICEVTGASRAKVDGVTIRTKAGKGVEETKEEMKRREINSGTPKKEAGGEFDQFLKNLPQDVARVTGKDKATAEEPARFVHVDYTLKGLKDMVRWQRADIRKVAGPILEAEDAVARGEQKRVPRYASYSIWRPLDTVQRDPLALLDWRTLDKDELVPFSQRAPSSVTENGESRREPALLAPPKDSGSQKWYYLSGQTPDEALVIRFADTKAKELGVAEACCHGSPILPSTETLPARRSLECRIFAFWD